MIREKIGLVVVVILEIARLVATLILFLTIVEATTQVTLFRGILGTLCHQRPERCFSIAGRPIALCARCLGIYLGIVPGPFLFPRFRWLIWLLLPIFALEIATRAMVMYSPSPIRFLSGFCLSLAIYLSLSRLSWALPKHAEVQVRLE